LPFQFRFKSGSEEERGEQLVHSGINGLYYKSLMIIIYDRIDSGQYYKTMITIVSYAPNLTLALSSLVNYDRKWRHNLEHH
jgi:hypothetical protein